LGRRLSISLRKHATVFQPEVYAILACVYEIQMNARPEKYISIFSEGWVAHESFSGCQNNVSIITTLPKGVE
jgi:hypothetical protein